MNRIKDIETNYKTDAKVSFGRCSKIKICYKPKTIILQQTNGTLIRNGLYVMENFRNMFEEPLNKLTLEKLGDHRIL